MVTDHECNGQIDIKIGSCTVISNASDCFNMTFYNHVCSRSQEYSFSIVRFSFLVNESLLMNSVSFGYNGDHLEDDKGFIHPRSQITQLSEQYCANCTNVTLILEDNEIHTPCSSSESSKYRAQFFLIFMFLVITILISLLTLY